ncbi:MAG: DUF1592 domain-containing protein, partial [Methylococcaceae bacterium]|nr:DUF1592 domain-containing protein [Methylococcaceae bacterium]
FIASFGKRAYRRPLTEAEITDYLGIFASGSFTDSVTSTVMRMLVSPHFLYRSELGDRQADGSYRLTPYETASALSYLFLGSMPDDALFAAADSNQLNTPQQRLPQAARLIALPRARAQVGNFVGQWLLSSSPYTLPEKDQGVYPRYTPAVKAALSEELIGFFNHVAFDSSQSFPELFSADYVMANKTLADYYGLTGPTGTALQETPVANGTRTGILTLGAVLSRYANSNESHPFKRGGFLYKRVLCHDLPPPANMGLIVAPQQDPNATTRQRFAFHSKSNASCYSCHQFLDEPGFGFENYDGAGIFRASENGEPIDASGTLRGMETFTPEEQVQFADLPHLSRLVSASPAAAQCAARQYYRYTTGRREANADSCALDSFIQSYSNNGYNLQTMLLGIVNAPGFQSRTGTGGSVSASSGCAGQALCDGFETAINGQPDPATWSVATPSCAGTGKLAIDTAVAHGGSKSLRVDGQGGYCNHVFIANSAIANLGSTVYGRFYVRFAKALTANHVTFGAFKDQADGGKDLRMGGQSQILMWNRESDDATLPELGPTGISLSVAPKAGSWQCVEFGIDQTKGSLQTWVDGTAVAALQVDATSTAEIDRSWLSRGAWTPSLKDFRLGWESYGSDANTLWFDDVALGTQRIGCN